MKLVLLTIVLLTIIYKVSSQFYNIPHQQKYFNESIYPQSGSDWKFDLSFLSDISHKDSKWDILSTTCREDLNYTVRGIIGKLHSQHQSGLQSKYIFPLIDSWAKLPPPGILRGNVRVTGQYEECTNIHYYAPELKRNIDGEYYGVFVDDKFRSHKQKGACGIQFSADMCLPKSCSKENLLPLFQSANPIICQVLSINQTALKPDAGFWITAVLMTLLTVICLICSIVDFYLPEEIRDGMSKVIIGIMQAFSMHRNMSEIFAVNKINTQTGCLNCIRSFSICWVVAGHTFLVSMFNSNNLLDQYQYASSKLAATFYVNAYYSVDSFFFMSGFVLAYTFFKALKQNPKMLSQPITWIMFYVHRFLRLSPSYYFSIFFYGFVVQVMLRNMPLYIIPEAKDLTCHKNWIWNILYINNFIKSNSDEICYGPSWYIAVDFQLYIFSPILLLAFAIFGTLVGLIVAFLLCVIAAGLSVFFVLHWDLPPTGFAPGWKYHFDGNKHNFWLYNFPLVRMQPYVIGIVLGYLLLKKRSMRFPLIVRIIMWILSLGGLIGLILIGYTWTEGTGTTLAGSAAFNALARLGWSLCLTWIVVACYYQQGGPIGDFMNWHIWVPLARLSYSVYLTHLGLIILSTGLMTQRWQFRNGFEFFIMTVCPVILYSFVFSTYWTAVFEKPFAKMQSLFLVRTKRVEDSAKESSIEASEENKNKDSWS